MLDSDKACWPGGARVAVVFQLVFSRWAGSHVTPGRHTAPQLPPADIARGVPDLVSLSWQDYAGRAGFYRLMDVVQEHGIPATGQFSGIAAETYPDIVREFAGRGNEIAARSWAEDVRAYTLVEEEVREDMRRTRAAIESITGAGVVGWASADHQASNHTLKAAAEEGMLYLNEMCDGDWPVMLERDGCRILGIPPAFDVSDHQMHARGLNGPSAYIEMFTRQLETLAGQSGPPKLMTASFNAALFGHPIGGWALDRCIRLAKGTPGTWITTHRDCAARWLAGAST